MRVLVGLSLALIACGRIGFDASGIRADAGPGSGAASCLPGMPCQIECNTPGPCDADCGSASTCTIDCNVPGSCVGGTIVCHQGCTVACRASDTCDSVAFTCGAIPALGCDLRLCVDNGTDNHDSFSGSRSVTVGCP